ncbi:MAG: cation transporter [Candidatus Limnocylindria bacterium]
MPSAHGAQHHSAAGASRGRLFIVLALVVGYLLVEVVGSLLTNSLALLADAGHMLTDAVGVGLALLAIHFAARPATAAKSYGYYRLENLAAVGLSDDFDMEHSTIQLETTDRRRLEEASHP